MNGCGWRMADADADAGVRTEGRRVRVRVRLSEGGRLSLPALFGSAGHTCTCFHTAGRARFLYQVVQSVFFSFVRFAKPWLLRPAAMRLA